jgi:hypothetical protein
MDEFVGDVTSLAHCVLDTPDGSLEASFVLAGEHQSP